MIRVLVADDHTVVREGLKRIISETKDIVVYDEACNGEEALQKVLSGGCDTVLLDISMPGISGLEVLHQIRHSNKTTPRVIILTVSPEDHYATLALREGADGYLTKDSLPSELINAIRRVASGRKYITTALAEQIATNIDNPLRVPHECLSQREYCVMHMLASGKTVSEVARELSLSVKTVSTYRSRVLEKMHMRNNSEIVRYAIQNQLV